MPKVHPLKVKDPKVKQPAYPLRSLPANTLHIGPSGSGKSVALIRTLIDKDKLGGVLPPVRNHELDVVSSPQAEFFWYLMVYSGIFL